MTIPSYSKNNPHPTAVIREMRYMVRNAMAFYAPIADWCIETGLIKGSPAMGGVKYEITEAGLSTLRSTATTIPNPIDLR